MASSRSLGSLTLDLIAKIGGFTDSLDKASRKLDDKLSEMEKRAYESGQAIGEAIRIGFELFLGKETIDKIGEVIRGMDELGKAAQKVGLPVEQFSSLAAAAQLSNVSMEELQSTLGKLSKSEAQALDSTSQQGKIFRALGISVKDANGNLKSSATVMEEFADRFKELGNNSTTTAAGIELFGKNFQDLIPFLEQGSEGIKAAQEEAVELGATLTGDAAKAAAQFEDNLTKIKLAGQGIFNQLVQQLLPVLNDWSDSLVELAKDHQEVTRLGQFLADDLRGLAAIAIEVAAGFQVIKAAIETVTVAISADVQAFQLMRDAYSHPFDTNKIKQDFGQILSNASVARDQISDIWSHATDSLNKYQAAAIKQLSAIGDHQKKVQSDVDSSSSKGNSSSKNKGMLAALQNALNPQSQQQADKMTDTLAALAAELNNISSTSDATQKAYDEFAKTIATIFKLEQAALKAGNDVTTVQGLVNTEVAKAQEKLATGLAAPMKAAQAYTDQLQAQYDAQKDVIQAQVDSIGMGTKEAQNEQQLAQVRKQGADALAQLQKQYETHPESMTKEQYDIEVAALKKHNEDMVQLTKDGQDAISAAQQDWLNGVNKAWKDFVDQQNNTAQIAGQITTDFLDKGSDAFAEFIDGTKSAKDAFKDFINDIEQEITRAVAKQLFKQLFNIGGDSSGNGSWLSSIFSSSGSSQGSIFDLFSEGGLFSFAGGGNVPMNSLSRVNERGPELLSVGGKDYLMMGSNNGHITPSSQIGRGGSNVQNNFYLAAPTSPKTQAQIANKAAYEMRRASRLS